MFATAFQKLRNGFGFSSVYLYLQLFKETIGIVALSLITSFI